MWYDKYNRRLSKREEMKIKSKTKTFKENLKNMLLKQVMIRIVIFEVICILLFVSVGLFLGIRQNKIVANKISVNLENKVARYSNYLNELSEMDDVMVSSISSVWNHDILKKLSQINMDLDINSNIYILDSERNLVISNKGQIPEENRNVIIKQWKILDIMDSKLDKAASDVSRGENRNLFLGKAIVKSNRIYAYLVLEINEKQFRELLLKNEQDIMVINSDRWVLSTNTTKFIDAIGRLDEDISKIEGFHMGPSGVLYVSSTVLSKCNLKVYTISDYTEVKKWIEIIILTSTIILLILLIWVRYSLETLAYDFTEDIVKLSNAFESVRAGNFDTQLSIDSSAEFENIQVGFHEMLFSLKDQMQKNLDLAEEVADEQVKRLKSQFKSHFLFNTLDNIRFICRVSPELTEKIIVLLSKILRYNTESQNEKVTIKEDFEYLEMYLDIIKIRFGDSFSYSVKVEKDIENDLVLKLLLQPLVENAIKYGFRDKDSIDVAVSAYRKDGNICMVCKDNGLGINEDLMREIRVNLSEDNNRTTHIGLYNVNKRIQLRYGTSYGIRLENDNGLVAKVIIPEEVG